MLDYLLGTPESETAAHEFFALFISVFYHLDNGSIHEAESILDELIERLENEKGIGLEGAVFTEKAFICAAYRKDVAAAELFLEKGKKGHVEDHTIARAESAILIANGEIENGILHAKQGLKVADHSPDEGGTIFEKEILRQLSQGVLPSLGHC